MEIKGNEIAAIQILSDHAEELLSSKDSLKEQAIIDVDETSSEYGIKNKILSEHLNLSN